MQKRHVQRPAPGAEELGDFRQKAGQVVHSIHVELGPHVAPHKEIGHAEALFKTWVSVSRVALRVEVDEFHVPETMRLQDEGIEEHGGSGAPTVHEYPLA